MIDGPIPSAYRPDEMYERTDLTVRTLKPAGSPRPLAIARDLVIIVVGLIAIAAAILVAVAANSAGNALDQLGNTTPTSAPGIPTCAPGETFGCVDAGN